jgi:mannose/fructose/N-acetylgalactosamine-specific phosphotransferase system component IID
MSCDYMPLITGYEGRMKDDATLRENKVTKGAKIMVVGSTVTEVLSVSEPAVKTSRDRDTVESTSSKEPLCKQKVLAVHFPIFVSLVMVIHVRTLLRKYNSSAFLFLW